MKKILMIFVMIGLIAACNNNTEKKEHATKAVPEKGQVIVKEGDVTIEKYANGINRKVRTYKKVNDKLVPVYEKLYYDDGKLSQEGPLKDGKRHGHWKSYYRDGTLWSEGDFVDGVAQGVTITYYPNGNKRYEGEFKDGQKYGNWKFWNENGEFVKNVTFVPKGKKLKTEIPVTKGEKGK